LVEGIEYDKLSSFLGPFMLIGGGFRVIDTNKILFFREKKRLESIFLETGPFPMFSTDYQPLMAILMTIAEGSSIIHETLFDNRLTYLYNLAKFGAKFTIDDHCYGNQCRFVNKNSDHSAIINGVERLFAPSDSIRIDTIRSGFAYIMAAIIADGKTELTNIESIMRGYSDLEKKLNQIGVELLPGSVKLQLAYGRELY
jgi:UDP-N-acetylglucosamine 1-carboxyvinyltransferase